MLRGPKGCVDWRLSPSGAVGPRLGVVLTPRYVYPCSYKKKCVLRIGWLPANTTSELLALCIERKTIRLSQEKVATIKVTVD